MAVPEKRKPAAREPTDDIKKLVRCNIEVDLIEAEVKALNEHLISKKVFDNLMSLKSKVPVAERYTTLLRHVHETLQGRLNISDAQATATQAVAEKLIEKDILVNIASLNRKVPTSLKARYLCLFLQPALQRQLEKFKLHLITIQSMLTNNYDMRATLKKYLKTGLIRKSVLTLLFPKLEDKNIRNITLKLMLEQEKEQLHYSLNTVGEITLPLNPSQSEAITILGPQHLPQLNELLVGYSSKWKNIGVALNFQSQDLETIEATPLLIPGGPQSYLFRLLQDWLQMTLKHTLFPTVENLKKALKSRTVGLGALGSELQAIVSKSTLLCTEPYSSTKISFDTNEPSVYPKCNEIYIGEDECTLLDIQVTTSGKEDKILYSWCRRGMSSGSQPILYLHRADIAWDGDDISCEVRHMQKDIDRSDAFHLDHDLSRPKFMWAGSSSIITVPITMHVSCPLDEFFPSLSSMYLSRPEVPEDTWPPTGSTKYINLAIIKCQRINYGSEYVRATIRGDIDDVLQDKETIDYAIIYDSLKSESQVMYIEGRPGSGKTTFVHKITHDWASNSSGGIRILLLVSLRVLNTIRNAKLSDILHLFRDLKVTPEIIEKRNGKGVCFIFDGLDEFSPSDGKDSVVYKIIDRSYLHQSTVVVASRPAALAKLRNKADKIIEVIGFSGNQIQEYFDHYPFSDASKPVKLKAYLSLHPNILHMCYLPIHATMVAFLFEVTGQVPKTETKMYERFTNFTLVRTISKNKELKPNAGDNILQCLNEEQIQYFKQICQLALNKTLSNKQVLHHEEISSNFQQAKKDDISLGLITIDCIANFYGYKDIYTFLHLTFQEYLAAYHISTLSDEEQMKLIEEHGRKNHMLVVWKFFCGLVEIKPFENKFKTILHKTQGNTLYHFQCAYESQQKIVCAQLLKDVHYNIQLANKFLNTPDFTAIGYVTNKATLRTKLSLANCNVDIAAIDALLSEVEDTSKKSLESLHIEAKNLSFELAPEAISKLLANFWFLKYLSLVTDAVVIDAAKQDTSKQPMESLHIKAKALTPEYIRKLLANFQSLKSLSLVTDFVAIDALFSEVEDIAKQSLESLHIKTKSLTPDLTHEDILKLLANFLSLKSLSLVTDVVTVDAVKQDTLKQSHESLHIEARDLTPEHIRNLLNNFQSLKSLSLVTDVVAIDSLYTKMKDTSKQLLESLHIKTKYLIPNLIPEGISKLMANFLSLKSLSLVTDAIAIDAAGQDITKQSFESLHIKARNLTPEIIPKFLANFQSLKSLSIVSDDVPIDVLFFGMEDTSLESVHIEAKNLYLELMPKLLANFQSLKSFCLSVKDVVAIDVLLSKVKDTSKQSLSIKAKDLNPELIRKLLATFQSLKSLSLVNDVVAIDALLSEMEDTSKQLLESLHIEAKDLTTEVIPKLLVNFQALKSLILVKQEDSSHSIQQASTCHEEVSVPRKIQTLTLKGFQEKSGIIKKIIYSIRQCENLTELNLTDNGIGEYGANILPQSLQHCRSLQRINISKNGISSDEIFNVLCSMKDLKIKQVKGITSQGKDVDRISNALLLKQLKQFTNLQSLDIELVDTCCDIFLHSCKEWKDLKELRIVSQPQYSLHTTMAVSRVLQLYFRNIEILALKDSINNIDGFESLIASLHKCSSLKVLDLSSNLLTQDHLQLLLSINFSRLEELYLENNEIRDSGAVLLSSHLQGFPSLQLLSISHNFITRSGAEALAAKLHHSIKLI